MCVVVDEWGGLWWSEIISITTLRVAEGWRRNASDHWDFVDTPLPIFHWKRFADGYPLPRGFAQEIMNMFREGCVLQI